MGEFLSFFIKAFAVSTLGLVTAVLVILAVNLLVHAFADFLEK